MSPGLFGVLLEPHDGVEVRHRAEDMPVGVKAVAPTDDLPIEHRPAPGAVKMHPGVVLVDEPNKQRDAVNLNRKFSHVAR